MIEVAKIGKTVGVYGGLKLHLLTDFPQIFSSDVTFFAQKGHLKQEIFKLKIKTYQDGIVCFYGYESLESAKTLTNAVLSMSIEDTRMICPLQEGEMFWFDLIGVKVVERGELLGYVKEIDRIGETDYLIVAANSAETKRPKTFMIPYIERYILSASSDEIQTSGAKDIWLES
ncbi:ribosome maturation factor RimM [Helicobacter pametensis]|uniref:ribosome maturation factor RimM n=1 Tax=Helicobacter pametensis TaxID=95149 RepID=UPI000482A99B|nr:ribosome maturation factor RimM [Helicobacter pametensis]